MTSLTEASSTPLSGTPSTQPPPSGLTTVGAKERLATQGPNELARAVATSPWLLLLEQFKSPVIAWALASRNLAEARNLAFSVLVFGELLRAFSARSTTRLFWEVGAFTNLRVVGVVVVSVLLQLGLHHIQPTQELFQIGALPLSDCVLSLGLGLVPVSVLELSKLLRRVLA